MYASGACGLRVQHQAVKYYQIAADAGLTDAAYDLGLMHANGICGLPVNKKQAVPYLRTAADAGHTDAAYYP